MITLFLVPLATDIAGFINWCHNWHDGGQRRATRGPCRIVHSAV
jgi:hypothetical protein